MSKRPEPLFVGDWDSAHKRLRGILLTSMPEAHVIILKLHNYARDSAPGWQVPSYTLSLEQARELRTALDRIIDQARSARLTAGAKPRPKT